MSIATRDYMRRPEPPDRFGPASWSIITKLMAISVVMFLLQSTVLYGSAIINSLELTGRGLGSGKIYQLISYQFLHGSLLHLASNMVGMYFLGKMAEQLVSSRHILWIYLLGGILGGIAQVLYDLAIGIDAPIVGASGSLMALIFAVATLIPNRTIYFLLFFVIPIKLTMRKAAFIIIAMNLATLLYQSTGSSSTSGPQIAVFGHFGGMFMGWAYVVFILPVARRRSKDRRRSETMKRRFGIKVIKDAQVAPPTDREEPRAKSDKKPFVSADVDAILDKISAEGMQSLTPTERKILEKSSKKLGRRIDRD